MDIWTDNWLSDIANPRLTTPSPEWLEHGKVSQLLCNGHEWNYEVVNRASNERDRALIFNIPLSISLRRDSLYWALEKDGIYLVKSAYYMLAEEVSTDLQPNFECADWAKLWQLHIPARMKQFLWKCATGVLPTKTRLQSRHVPLQDDFCELCREENETVYHAIIGCRCARDI